MRRERGGLEAGGLLVHPGIANVRRSIGARQRQREGRARLRGPVGAVAHAVVGDIAHATKRQRRPDGPEAGRQQRAPHCPGKRRRAEPFARRGSALDRRVVGADPGEGVGVARRDHGAPHSQVGDVAPAKRDGANPGGHRPAPVAQEHRRRRAIERAGRGVEVRRGDHRAMAPQRVDAPRGLVGRPVRGDTHAIVRVQAIPLELRLGRGRPQISLQRDTPVEVAAGPEIEPAHAIARRPRDVHALADEEAVRAAPRDLGRKHADAPG